MIPALVTICILMLAVILVVIIVHYKTKPRREGADDQVAIGGMLISDKFDYGSNRDKRLSRSPIVKLMQMMWLGTSKSDEKNHATQTAPAGIREINDIPYIKDGSRYHLLDVYYPEGIGDRLPVIIDVHGGGWMYGDKELNKLYCLALASRGYTVFNISYPLVPDVTVNEQIKDVMTALKWISDNLESYPAKRDDIILTGDSAGGMLAAYTGVLSASGDLCKIFDTRLPGLNFKGLLLTSPVPYMNQKGFMKLYTPKMWGSDYKKKATYDYMNFDQIAKGAKLPKTCLITSAGDFLAHDQTVQTYRLLTDLGINCKLMDFGGEEGKKLPHVFTVLNPYNEIGRKTIDEALEFLR